MPIDSARLAALAERAEEYLATKYHIPVRIRDVPKPFLGDLDGSQIDIDDDTEPSERLFLILHLFGHTVQWDTSARAREIGRPLPVPVSEELLPELLAYEKEAAGYAIALLHELGVEDLDQWFTDIAEADLAYLTHYYRTGEKRPVTEFFRANCEVVKPIAIPEFQPKQWIFRADGVVI
jgi:hypothetical protein